MMIGEKWKFHLVSWAQVCKPNEEGGLGIRQINDALLGKWLWRLEDSSEGLWKDILRKKYQLLGNGWRIRNVSRRASCFWKGVFSVADAFDSHIRYRPYSGEDILFWKDKWLGEVPLAFQFPVLFSFTANKEAYVKECFHLTQHKVVWGPEFRKQLEDWMVEDWVSLMNLLEGVFVVGSGKDRRIWDLDSFGHFFVKSFCNSLIRKGESPYVHPKVWKGAAPLKVKVFGWLVGLGKILTIDNLRRWRMLIVNACPLCLSAAESVNHLLLHCRFSSCIWDHFLHLLGVSFCLPRSGVICLMKKFYHLQVHFGGLYGKGRP